KNGTLGSELLFSSYGGSTSKPKIGYRLLPTAGQWTWDAGVSAWYITTGTAMGNGGCAVKINGQFLPSMGLIDSGGLTSKINAMNGINGITASTLRWFIPTGKTTLYVAGGGITSLVD